MSWIAMLRVLRPTSTCVAKKINVLNLSVNVFTTKVLIGGRYINVSYWRPPFYEGLAICRAKVVPSFLSSFKTLSIGPTPGIEPATSCSAVKRSTDWAYPAAVKLLTSLNVSGQTRNIAIQLVLQQCCTSCTFYSIVWALFFVSNCNFLALSYH